MTGTMPPDEVRRRIEPQLSQARITLHELLVLIDELSGVELVTYEAGDEADRTSYLEDLRKCVDDALHLQRLVVRYREILKP